MPNTDPTDPVTCPQCGAIATSRFCPECGHALTDQASASQDIRTVVREGAAEVIGFDQRILATVRDLLLRPGRVVAAHLTSGAKEYVHPLKLFLFLGSMYTLSLGLLTPFSFEAVANDRSAGSLTKLVYGASNAEELRKVFRDRGITEETANSRFQERSNASTPIATALALLPMTFVLGLLQRDRPRRDHFIFLLVVSNAIWLVGMLTMPLILAGQTAFLLGLYGGTYVYMGVGFFTVYGSQGRLRTATKFAAFLLADLIVTSIASLALSVAILASIFHP